MHRQYTVYLAERHLDFPIYAGRFDLLDRAKTWIVDHAKGRRYLIKIETVDTYRVIHSQIDYAVFDGSAFHAVMGGDA